MRLQVWNNTLDPYNANNTQGYAETEYFNITSFDSLNLSGVSYTEQEGRQVTVSNINPSTLSGCGFIAKTITNPQTAYGLTDYYDLRAIIYDDNNNVYLDGLIQKSTFIYDPYSKTVSFTICDMLSVFIEWLDKVKIRVNDDGTITVLGNYYIYGSQVTDFTYAPNGYGGTNLSRWTFSELLNIIRTSNQFSLVCPNLQQGTTTHTFFELLGTITSTIQLDNLEILSGSYHYMNNDNGYNTFIGESISPDRQTVVYSVITIMPYYNDFGLDYLYILNQYSYSYGYITASIPEPDEQTVHSGVQQIRVNNVTVPATSPVSVTGYIISGYTNAEAIDIMKSLCYRSAGFYPISWQSFNPTNGVAIRAENIDSVALSMTVTNSLVQKYNVLGQPFYINKVTHQMRALGNIRYIDCFVSQGDYTMKQLLKDIALSTDNYLYYNNDNGFEIISRSAPLLNSIGDITDIRSIVKGLNLDAKVSISICNPNPDYFELDEALIKYYKTVINENFNIAIEFQSKGTYPFALGAVITINGNNYRIFSIDYFNGTYRITAYGQGYNI